MALPQMPRLPTFAFCLLATSALALPCVAGGREAPRRDALSAGFLNPPNSARPRVWWHWMNGNVTPEGIDLDLAWMKRVGIGGLQNFDVNLDTPQVVDKRLVYMTPEWKAAFRHTAEVADQLGLELTIASSPGWSETGGPWVKPQDAMKKMVWSAADIEGGKRFHGPLPAPPSVTGPFQTVPAQIGGVTGHTGPTPLPEYYADAVVVAYPVAEAVLPTPVVSSSAGQVSVDALLDGDLTTVAAIGEGADGTAWVQYDFGHPVTVRSAAFGSPPAGLFGGSVVGGRLTAGNDGVVFQPVADLASGLAPQQTTSFQAVTARYFRLELSHKPGRGFDPNDAGAPGVDPAPVLALIGTPAGGADKPSFPVTRFVLSPEEAVQDAEVKAGFAIAQDFYALNRVGAVAQVGVPKEDVIDLTARLTRDGVLDWTPPAGRWRVLRIGYSLTGTENHPATQEATGLEVDKLDPGAVRNYMEHYLDTYHSFLGDGLMGRRGVVALLNDSTEVGPQNWTPKILDAFRQRRGYDARPWLPVLTGAVIGDGVRSDAFLYDFRKTLAELHAESHYKTVAEVAHSHGLFNYGEALEDGRPTLGDDLEMRRYATVPMAALWTYRRSSGPKPTYLADIRGAASVAHVYGQNLVAAESMTAAMSPWAFTPRDLKSTIDLEFDLGVNRPVVHTSVHQPFPDKKPGLSLAIFGQYFNRSETWAEMAGPWVDYMARNSFMLQQGRFYADIAYFGGEEAPFTGLYAHQDMPDAPHGYAFDFVNPEMVMNHLSMSDGVLISKSGATYRVLYLGGSSRRMTLSLLRRLHDLVGEGLTLAGLRPEGSPANGDDPGVFKRLADDLWPEGATQASFGKGRVLVAGTPDAAMALMGIAKDFDSGMPEGAAAFRFVHRRLPDGDIYFVNNRLGQPERLKARFRVTGKAPELWRPEMGQTAPLTYRVEGDVTVVDLDLAADDAVHVVFRGAAAPPARTVATNQVTRIVAVNGPWRLTFQPGRGAPSGQVTLPALKSWTDHEDSGIRYFSGVATYVQSLTVKRRDLKSGSVWLDLGDVRDLAEVWINGLRVGEVWHAPYHLDVTGTLRPGKNTLQVKVANPWVNRLIGDSQPGAKKITFTAMPTYLPSAPLRPSGLLGPVTVVYGERGHQSTRR